MDVDETNNGNDESIINVNIPLVTKIIYGIWLLICLVPNSILIRKLSKHEFYQSNFYYIIVHWSWSNILQMIYSIYVIFVPNDLAAPHLSVYSVFFYMVTQLPAQFALFFTIDKFVNSKKFCRNNTRMGYKSLGFAVILLSILAHHDVAHTYTLAIGFVAIESIVFLAFLISVIIHCIIGSDENNYCLRVTMASICIVTNYLYVVYVILNVILMFNLHEIYFYVTMVVHLNGMVNIMFLHFNDPNINIPEMISKKCSKDTSSEEEASQPVRINGVTVL